MLCVINTAYGPVGLFFLAVTDSPAAQQLLNCTPVFRVGDDAVEVDIVRRFWKIAGRWPVFMCR
jgi:hypothetical protein